uniref:Uncharacterized protein n=1 Tax=Meloidogyne enterolobii TaxID=390850 RepID=A0A6V7WFT4_MELEN|nr:unnamed protein product [Meloidogyne enterolobii]
MPDEKKAIENFTQGLDNITHGMKDGCSIVRALGVMMKLQLLERFLVEFLECLVV